MEKRIEKIKEYFIGMKVEGFTDENGKTSQVIFVTVKFPSSWILSDDTLEQFNVDCEEDPQDKNKYHFWSDFETGFGSIFDAIDSTIEKNKIAAEKALIFREKIDELKKIFEDDDITVSELRSLTMNYRGKSRREKARKENIAVKEEIPENIPEENNNEENMEE